jgi:hypothetical protein
MGEPALQGKVALVTGAVRHKGQHIHIRSIKIDAAFLYRARDRAFPHGDECFYKRRFR